jgi:hypothetical protein
VLQKLHGIETPADYLREYVGVSDPVKGYNSAPFDVLYRAPCYSQSEMAIVLKNPNITPADVEAANVDSTLNSQDPPNRRIGEDYRILNNLSNNQSLSERFKTVSRESAYGIGGWFTNHPGPQVRMKELIREVDTAGLIELESRDDETVKSYLSPQENNKTGRHGPEVAPEDIAEVYDDFYVTELCKLRAPTGNWPFSPEEESIAKWYLIRELKAVNPDIIFVLGQKPTSTLSSFANEQIEPNLYRSRAFNGAYIITLDHPSYPQADYSPLSQHLSTVT